MAINYDIYQTPTQNSRETNKFHARVVLGNPKSDKELIETINKRCTLTPSDIKGVLTALSDFIKDEMLEGHRVHLEGIGYLYPVITMNKEKNEKKIISQDITVKSISFRAEKEIINELKSKAEFCLSKRKNHSATYSDEDISITLRKYFEKNEEIDRATFQQLFSLTKSTSFKVLKRAIDMGIITQKGTHQYPRYTLK